MTHSREDPFTIEIIQNSLAAISDEMFEVIRRTAMSPIIYEALDYSVSITDGDGNMLTQGNGVPVFLGVMDSLVGEILERYRDEPIRPGDIFVSNDPYGGGSTHLSDIAVISPVFFDNQLIAFVVNKSHFTEVGGKDPGSWTTNAVEVFQEGLQLPYLKLFSEGCVNQSIVSLLEANVRLPQMTLGDLWAGVAANRVGTRRMHDLIGKYGLSTFIVACRALLNYGERSVCTEINNLPKGTYCAEDVIDDDGLGNGPFPIKVRVDISENDFTVDFSGSNAQVPGPINASRTATESGVRAIFKALTNPNIPANAGCFRPLNVICPAGTVFTADRPAPVSLYWETIMAAADLIWKALAPHIPERLPAGHFLSVCGTMISGTHPITREYFLMVEPLVGGWGASFNADGQNGQFASADGETYNIPIEILETLYGIRATQYGFHNEDGGHGQYRGGKGVVLELEILAEDATLTASFGRHASKPWSVGGAASGTNNRIEIERLDGSIDTHAMPSRVPLFQGDRLRLITGTGGGYGDPHLRDPNSVKLDLVDGYITADQSLKYYLIDSGD